MDSRTAHKAAVKQVRVKLLSPYGFWRFVGPYDDSRLFNGHPGTFVSTSSVGTIVDWDDVGKLSTPLHWIEFDA